MLFIISFLKSVEVLTNGKSFFALSKFALDLSDTDTRLKNLNFESFLLI